jgi:hypothetical protein
MLVPSNVALDPLDDSVDRSIHGAAVVASAQHREIGAISTQFVDYTFSGIAERLPRIRHRLISFSSSGTHARRVSGWWNGRESNSGNLD